MKTIVSGAILILFFFFKTFCISTHVYIPFFVFFLYKVFINTFHVPKSGAWRKRWCSIVAFHQLSSLSVNIETAVFVSWDYITVIHWLPFVLVTLLENLRDNLLQTVITVITFILNSFVSLWSLYIVYAFQEGLVAK